MRKHIEQASLVDLRKNKESNLRYWLCPYRQSPSQGSPRHSVHLWKPCSSPSHLPCCNWISRRGFSQRAHNGFPVAGQICWTCGKFCNSTRYNFHILQKIQTSQTQYRNGINEYCLENKAGKGNGWSIHNFDQSRKTTNCLPWDALIDDKNCAQKIKSQHKEIWHYKRKRSTNTKIVREKVTFFF